MRFVSRLRRSGFFCDVSQAFRPGLACAAPTALDWSGGEATTWARKRCGLCWNRPDHGRLRGLCRAYGALDFSCDDSQAFRPGLAYVAPTALVPWHSSGKEPARHRRYSIRAAAQDVSRAKLSHE